MYTISVTFMNGTPITSLGATVRNINILTSMDSLFPQAELFITMNDFDLLGRGMVKFGTELSITIADKDGDTITKSNFCVFNIQLIDNISPHSTVGTIKLSCVGRWYFKQMARSVIYKGSVSQTLLQVLTDEAGADYGAINIRQSNTFLKSVWYRCKMTASKFIKKILEPNFLIDNSPSYIYADDLGQIVTDSLITLTERKPCMLFIDPYILQAIAPTEDLKLLPLGISGLSVNLGNEYAWQYQAQRLDFLSAKYSSISGGLEPTCYFMPSGFPGKLYALESSIYYDPLIASQIISDDSGNESVSIRAKFLNTHRKKGYEAFQIEVETDNSYILTVGATVRVRLTSLPQGNPNDLKARLQAESIRYPSGIDNSILSGEYFIKRLVRKFISNSSGRFTCLMTSNLIKVQ